MNIVKKILAMVPLGKDVAILEIGPGRGVLTGEISKNVKKINAVEIDRVLVSELQTKFRENSTVHIHLGDILKLDLEKFGKDIHVVGNLPFNITSPILFKLFDYEKIINTATLMVQKEVADRIVSQVGNSDYGILSVMAQFHWTILKRFNVSASVFRPQPKVNASVFHAKFRSFPNSKTLDQAVFRRFVKIIFAHRRKTLANNLKLYNNGLWDILKDNFDLQLRAQSLEIREIISMVKIISEKFDLCLDKPK